MQYFHAQQIEMGAAKHLTLQKFEPIDMSLCDAVTLGPGESCVHGGIIPQDAIGKTLEFGDLTRFRSVQPPMQYLGLPLFEQGHKFLAQAIDGVEFLVEVHLLKLLLLHRGRVVRGIRSSERLRHARKGVVSLAERRDVVCAVVLASAWEEVVYAIHPAHV